MDDAPYVYRPTPRFATYFGIAILVAIGLPVAILDPARLLTFEGLAVFLCPLLCAAPLVLLLSNRFDISRTSDGRALRVVARLWMRTPVETLYSFDDLVGAEVEERHGRGGPASRVVLLFADGERIPLTAGYSAGSAHERCVEAIRAMIAGRTR